MLRDRLLRTTWLAAGCAFGAWFALGAAQVFAQDAQAQATAEVAKEKAAQDAVPLTTPAVPKDPKADEEKNTPKTNPEDLKRRAGERVGQTPRGRSLVLGMHLQESERGHVTVVEVAAASPAFNAGVKAGDLLVSFSGFHGDNYRKWIEGISRLATDAEESSRLPVTVARDGKQVDLQIRIPESHVGPVTLPIGPLPQQGTPPNPQAAGVGVQGIPVPGGGSNVTIDNSGPFGNFFGGNASPASEKAMAEIFRVGAAPTSAAEGVNPNTPPSPPRGPSARIGMAGFRSDANGMLVMVDVGALPPGNYLVAITDPSLVGGQPGVGVAPNVPTQPGTPPSPPPGVAPGANGVTNPAVRGTQPQSNAPPATSREIPRTVLAQVTDSAPPTGQVNPLTAPPTGQVNPLTASPTGQVNPLTAPPTGQVNPSNTTPTGQSTVNNALNEQARQAKAARAGAGATGGPVLNQIGTLTVDQSGTGRMQKIVEAVRVQDAVGQAIVLYSQANGQNTLPADLNPTVDPTPNNVTDPASPAVGQPAVAATAGGQSPNAPKPVAAGIIRLLPDHRPGTPGEPAAENTQPAPVAPPAGQPASNTPPVGANPIR